MFESFEKISDESLRYSKNAKSACANAFDGISTPKRVLFGLQTMRLTKKI